MKKIIMLCILSSKFICTSEKQGFILPSGQEIFALLSTHIRSWSEITLRDLSQELSNQTHSKTSLNDYLLQRMLGDTQIICTELSNAAEALAQQANKMTN